MVLNVVGSSPTTHPKGKQLSINCLPFFVLDEVQGLLPYFFRNLLFPYFPTFVEIANKAQNYVR